MGAARRICSCRRRFPYRSEIRWLQNAAGGSHTHGGDVRGPGDDPASARKGRDGRLGLEARRRRVDADFMADLQPIGVVALLEDAVSTSVLSDPGHHPAAIREPCGRDLVLPDHRGHVDPGFVSDREALGVIALLINLPERRRSALPGSPGDDPPSVLRAKRPKTILDSLVVALTRVSPKGCRGCSWQALTLACRTMSQQAMNIIM